MIKEKEDNPLKILIQDEMTHLSQKENTVFLGENVINSGRIYGTLNFVDLKKCIEMPVAENLITGTAIGLSLEGFVPICIFQRMDFMLIASDAIINHACLLPKMTGGKVKCGVIFRTIQAGPINMRFYVGHQHSKDLGFIFEPFMKIIRIPELPPKVAYKKAYTLASQGKPVLVVEDYESFNKPLSIGRKMTNGHKRTKG